MKKRILVGLVVFFTCSLSAQNKKLIGVWKLNYETRIDTTAAGIDQINADYDAYRKGIKKLSHEYMYLERILPGNESEIWKVTIKEGKDVFLVTSGDYLKKEIIYSPKTNKHYITMQTMLSSGKEVSLLVKYDEKNQHLSFVDEETGVVAIDFSRI